MCLLIPLLLVKATLGVYNHSSNEFCHIEFEKLLIGLLHLSCICIFFSQASSISSVRSESHYPSPYVVFNHSTAYCKRGNFCTFPYKTVRMAFNFGGAFDQLFLVQL